MWGDIRMETLLQWIGALMLLGMLSVLIPVFFMLIVTLQFKVLGGQQSNRNLPPGAHGRRSV